jgi:hypothetical protein
MSHFKIRSNGGIKIISSSAFTPANTLNQLTASQYLMNYQKLSVPNLNGLQSVNSSVFSELKERIEKIEKQLEKTDKESILKELKQHTEEQLNATDEENTELFREAFAKMHESLSESIKQNKNLTEEDVLKLINSSNLNSVLSSVKIDETTVKEHIHKLILDIRQDLSNELNDKDENLNLILNEFENSLNTSFFEHQKDLNISVKEELRNIYSTLYEEIENIHESLNNRFQTIITEKVNSVTGKDGLNGLTVYSFEKLTDADKTISLETTHTIIERYLSNTLTLPTPHCAGVYKVLSLSNEGVPFHLIKTNRSTFILERQPITVWFDGEKWCNIDEAKWLPLTAFGDTIEITGKSIDLNTDGTILAVGCPFANNGIGKVCIYQREKNGWELSDTLVGDETIGKSNFGSYVKFTLDSKRIIIGGSGDNSNTGAIWIFHIKELKTNEEGITERIWENIKLISDHGKKGGKQGCCISVSRDDYIAIGAEGENRVYVYHQDSVNKDEWNEIVVNCQEIDDNEEDAGFGTSVSLSSNGSILAVGAKLHTNSKGKVYLYKKIKDDFGSIQYNHLTDITPEDIEGSTNFGCCMALSSDGKILCVGGAEDNYGMGAVWIYRINKEKVSLLCPKLSTNNSKGMMVAFGSSVHYGNSVLFVGCPDDDSGKGKIDVFVYDKEVNEMVHMHTINLKSSGVGQSLSVSLDGRTICFSGIDESKKGMIYTFS